MAKHKRSVDAAEGRQWQERIRGYEGNGQTVREFCRSEEVPESRPSTGCRGRLGRCALRRRQGQQAQANVSQAKRAEARSNAAELVPSHAARFLTVRRVMDQAREAGSGGARASGATRVRVAGACVGGAWRADRGRCWTASAPG
jgi:hypothetical protein